MGIIIIRTYDIILLYYYYIASIVYYNIVVCFHNNNNNAYTYIVFCYIVLELKMSFQQAPMYISYNTCIGITIPALVTRTTIYIYIYTCPYTIHYIIFYIKHTAVMYTHAHAYIIYIHDPVFEDLSPCTFAVDSSLVAYYKYLCLLRYRQYIYTYIYI